RVRDLLIRFFGTAISETPERDEAGQRQTPQSSVWRGFAPQPGLRAAVHYRWDPGLSTTGCRIRKNSVVVVRAMEIGSVGLLFADLELLEERLDLGVIGHAEVGGDLQLVALGFGVGLGIDGLLRFADEQLAIGGLDVVQVLVLDL